MVMVPLLWDAWSSPKPTAESSTRRVVDGWRFDEPPRWVHAQRRWRTDNESEFLWDGRLLLTVLRSVAEEGWRGGRKRRQVGAPPSSAPRVNWRPFRAVRRQSPRRRTLDRE